MPQAILPMFSEGMTIINHYMAVQQKGDTVYWFQGNLPVFRHHVRDEKLFRLFSCQLINLGVASAAEISHALGVNREKLSRWARQERSVKLSPTVSVSSITKKKPIS